MRVLVISHNVFSNTTNMGKTLKAYFQGEDFIVAQLYVHSEIPTDDCCKNYYRITDKDMIRSIFTRKSGTVFGSADINKDAVISRTDNGISAMLYQKARKRTPIIYIARNLWWRFGCWKSTKLLRWIDEFDPEVIFFASGDYSFSYNIALELSQYKGVPLIVSCMDDYYFYNKNEDKLFGKLVYKRFMNQVFKTMKRAACLVTICDKMSEDYQAFFNKPCYTFHTSSSIIEPLSISKSNAISYIGNLGYKRNEQLIKIGRALKKISCKNKPDFIDVFSAENRAEILKDLTEENGIRFRGAISFEEVLEVIGRSLAVIHVESFDKNTRCSVAYSVSTKIADSLASGTCVFAYGPAEVASMEYLSDNQAAVCVTDDKDLEKRLQEMIENEKMRNGLISNAITLSKKNHNPDENSKKLKEIILSAVNNTAIV